MPLMSFWRSRVACSLAAGLTAASLVVACGSGAPRDGARTISAPAAAPVPPSAAVPRVVLLGSISMTRFQRSYEAAVLKTLGATTRRIAAMLTVEYGLLGFLAGVIGSAGALVLSWAVSAFVLDVPRQSTPAPVVAGMLASSALVTVVGILASLDVLGRKPLATLRAE